MQGDEKSKPVHYRIINNRIKPVNEIIIGFFLQIKLSIKNCNIITW